MMSAVVSGVMRRVVAQPPGRQDGLHKHNETRTPNGLRATNERDGTMRFIALLMAALLVVSCGKSEPPTHAAQEGRP